MSLGLKVPLVNDNGHLWSFWRWEASLGLHILQTKMQWIVERNWGWRERDRIFAYQSACRKVAQSALFNLHYSRFLPCGGIWRVFAKRKRREHQTRLCNEREMPVSATFGAESAPVVRSTPRQYIIRSQRNKSTLQTTTFCDWTSLSISFYHLSTRPFATRSNFWLLCGRHTGFAFVTMPS